MESRPDPPLSANVPPEGFAEFYGRAYAQVVRLAFGLTWDRGAGEELAQEAFLRTHSRFSSLDNPDGYVRVVVVNLCRDWNTRHERDQRHARLAVARAELSVDSHDEYLLDILAGLPFRQRAVVVLRYWNGWSESEIADALSCRRGTVKSLGARAMKSLREKVVR